MRLSVCVHVRVQALRIRRLSRGTVVLGSASPAVDQTRADRVVKVQGHLNLGMLARFVLEAIVLGPGSCVMVDFVLGSIVVLRKPHHWNRRLMVR
jgi:hypothetical protein